MPVPSQQERVRKAHRLLDPANGPPDMNVTNWLETCPISPPHGIYTDSMVTTKAFPVPLETGVARANNVVFEKSKLTDVLDKIAYIKFKPVENNSEGQLGAITFTTKLARDAPRASDRAGLIPCWYLPWRSAKLVHFAIPDVAGTPRFTPHGYDPIDNPPLFFTAAINGCSVFAYGAPQSPRVAHGGISGKMSEHMEDQHYQDLGGTSHTVWRNLLEGVKTGGGGGLVPKAPGDHKHQTLKQNRAGGSFGEVKPTDYVSRPTASGTEPLTDEAEHFETLLQNTRQDSVTQVMVYPFGCVFGLRSASGAWAFTLQRNATVKYLRVYQTRKFFFMKGKTATRGPDPSRPSLAFYSAVNLGFTRFFPSPSYVHYHAQASIQLF